MIDIAPSHDFLLVLCVYFHRICEPSITLFLTNGAGKKDLGGRVSRRLSICHMGSIPSSPMDFSLISSLKYINDLYKKKLVSVRLLIKNTNKTIQIL